MTTTQKLSQDEYVPLAPEEPGTVHVHHCKEGHGNDSLYITRKDDDTILAYCHHCGASGVHSVLGSRTIQGRKKVDISVDNGGNATGTEQNNSSDTSGPGTSGDSSTSRANILAAQRIDEYSNASTDPRDWPAHAKKWWLEYGLTYDQATRFGVVYSEEVNAMILPINLWKHGSVQYRYFDKDSKLKYQTFGSSLSSILRPGSITSLTLVLVEDYRSAVKVSQYTSAVPLLSTKMSDKLVQYIIEEQTRSNEVLVWLDNDNRRVVQDAEDLQRKLQQCLKIPVYRVKKADCSKDPKELNLYDLRNVITGVTGKNTYGT